MLLKQLKSTSDMEWVVIIELTYDFDTKDKNILEAARLEFLKYGFPEASTRSIARKAGVTTGAVYQHFGNKQRLFSRLVDPFISLLKSHYEKLLKTYHEAGAIDVAKRMNESNRITDALIDDVYNHYDLFQLIMSKSKGTSYDNMLEKIAIFTVKTETNILGRIPVGNHFTNYSDDIDQDVLHAVARGYWSAFVDIMLHDYGIAAAKDKIRQMNQFFA